MRTFTAQLFLGLAIWATGPIFGQTLFVPGQIGASSASGRVGIGTANPTSVLHVNAGTTTALVIETDNHSPWGFRMMNKSAPIRGLEFYQENDGTSFLYGGYPNGTFLSLGYGPNAGIGTGSPTAKLEGYGGDLKISDIGSGQVAQLLLNSAWGAAGEVGFLENGNLKFLVRGGSDGAGGTLDFADRTDGHRSRLFMSGSGNIGIGTSSPTSPLHVKGGFAAIKVDTAGNGGTYGDVAFYEGGARIGGIRGHNVSNSNYAGMLEIWSDTGNISFSSGNVGIGTLSPVHKLSVNGVVKAKEIIIETSGWADHVFADEYELAPLDEVEAHILEWRHLPGMPSAGDVAEKGISVGDMQAKLLEKIEELTLHVIAQQKQIAAQETRMRSQDEVIARLSSLVERDKD